MPVSQATPRIVAFGDNVVDCYRDRQQMFPGGNCVNHAVFARRFGAETAYAGAVSDDAPAARSAMPSPPKASRRRCCASCRARRPTA